MEAFNWHPRAFRLRGFLTPEECDFLMAQVSMLVCSLNYERP